MNVVRTLLVIVLVLAPAAASAQATLVNGLGGPLGYGTQSLARGDDSISAEVDLTPIFPTGFDFFGRHFTSLFVNTNGNVSFGGPLATFTPTPFPLPASCTGMPMVAPWWADVDTRAPLPADANQNLVYWAVDAANHRFVATWTQVGYFFEHTDKLDSFQLVLTPNADGMTFDVEMRYARCEWTTGDVSGGSQGLGGTPAQAGFDAANGVDFLALPGSLTMSVLDLCTTSNVGMAGVWQLHGTVTPVCGNGQRETGEECDDGADHTRCDTTCHLVSATDAGTIDAASPDAGPCTTTMPDTGPRRPDAGTRFDAGVIAFDTSRPDVGPPPPATFDITGGGCGCRAGGRSSGMGATVIAAIVVITRSRARARARAGTTRRP
jgi:hypothetical protein